jgi:hypothetical protein
MPAIFQIRASMQRGDGNWMPVPGGNGEGTDTYSVFTNDVGPNYGVGAPVCVKYPDKLGVKDNFKFELYILVKDGTGFSFKWFHTWTFSDSAMIDAGADGVVDFELGNCNVGGADLPLAPYINLPETVRLKVVETAASQLPSDLLQYDGTPGYFTVNLDQFAPAGTYDIPSGQSPVDCARKDKDIQLGSTHTMFVTSSLQPELMHSTYAKTKIPWDKINWLVNHLMNYENRTWNDIQQAFWMLEDPTYNGLDNSGYVPDITGVGLQMVKDANLLGGGFVPAPGDYAAVAFEDTTNPDNVQIVIIKIDP